MFSLTDLINALKAVAVLANDLKRHDEELKQLRTEVRDLTIAVHALAQEIKNEKERSAQRHENLLLEVENRLLRFERALPPTKKAVRKASKKAAKR